MERGKEEKEEKKEDGREGRTDLGREGEFGGREKEGRRGREKRGRKREEGGEGREERMKTQVKKILEDDLALQFSGSLKNHRACTRSKATFK